MLGRNKGQKGERTAADRAAAAAERARRRGVEPPPSADYDPAEQDPQAAAPTEPESYEPEPYDAPTPDEPEAPRHEPAAYEPEDLGHEPATYEPEAPRQEPATYEPEAPRQEPAAYEPAPAAARPQPYEPDLEPWRDPDPATAHHEPAWHEPEPDPATTRQEAANREPATSEREAVSWFEADAATRTRPWEDPVEVPDHHEPEPPYEPEPGPAPVPHVPRSGRRAAPPIAARAGGGGGRRPAPPRPAGRGGKPPTAPRRPVPAGARPPSRWGRRAAVLVVLLVVAGAAWAALMTFQPFHGEPSGIVRVQVPTGADAGEIGDLLEREGVVSSGRFFSVNATVTGRRGSLVAGRYTLQRDMSYGAVLDALSKGPKAAPKPKTYKVTVPEGLSIDETAARVRADIEGSYTEAANSAQARRRARGLGMPRGTDTTEGFLFPATYDLVKGAAASDLVDQQLDAYEANTSDVSYRRARSLGMSRYEVLVIASMIERETSLDRERPLVAAVIYNRLKQGMPLAIDATTRYAEKNWDEPLKQSELERPGPFNTRLNRGLPPTPIGNPGTASIEAAADPSSRDFLYYVVKPGTQGHAFSSTEAQFARDVAAYNAAREANGGNAP